MYELELKGLTVARLLGAGTRGLLCKKGSVTGIVGGAAAVRSGLLRELYDPTHPGNEVVYDMETLARPRRQTGLLMHLPERGFLPGQLTVGRVFMDFGLPLSGFAFFFPDVELREDRAVSNLSNRVRRLLEIYLVSRGAAHFILLEEPFEQVSERHLSVLREIWADEKLNKGILMTSLFREQVYKCCSRVYLVNDR